MGAFKKYIHKYWRGFLLAIVCLILEASCDLLQPTIMSKVIDIGVKNRQIDYVFKMGGIMLGVTALGALAACGRNFLSSSVSQKFSSDIRVDIFKKIQDFSLDNIDKFSKGSLITRITNDVTLLQNFANGLMRIFVKSPIVCIGSIIMALRLNIKLSVVLLGVIPIIALVIFLNMNIGYPYFIRVQRALDRVNNTVREYLSGVRVVKAFNRFDYETDKFKKINDDYSLLSASAMRIMSIFSPINGIIVNIGIIIILWIGAVNVNAGNMQVGQIIAFTNYMTQILFSIMIISSLFNMSVRARASAERIGEIFKEESTLKYNNIEDKEIKYKGRIDFEHVYFSYGNKDKPALKDINFTCMPGENVGIIGSTGSGKTTLVNLIPRFYDVTSGSVKIDGVDVKDMDKDNLMDRIAIVPQKSILFTGKVIDNIKWGKEDASLNEVIEASKISQAHEFILKFPEKYNVLIGQGGVNFSGGQKQRVAIARAVIKRTEILIMDDATSAVDVTTESKIRKSLKNYTKNFTLITIAQRITSVMGLDKIIVLDNGEIKGIGKHEELIKNCDAYKDIFYSQMGKEMISIVRK
ncbi:ABC-type multidrug transport system, ATPase and permease component [Clostridium pasteurianum DSM 525 = ATCC 6013]|uniref:ABC-type multidrug transport system, ATPase and permease component n=1 Tax=Clostridium pasteurianum DSM 525 = ATCC 6013 TaxID=1262449 RepID=A0A0H3J5V4_CLOPA|nr:ABC transporter ATP-binding protein [Clostridium pasteurianum]AJA49396.1 ABC-type multidrug transport system, ATPase and permease component [Clostridium pasteurianum DSM 525 = ATCC 6013]AJA53384.1 ABC-type multidrug transport system, ATPase and permease component [Clostridium pasteurianum DSM 525 = ATCC 6013]AOZ76567.1 ABC transporter [Clostridium pasteurianum DSM 525 = ATCC 6013]AOZ80364.1 ABC transporter [Clostridium pasteurianum]ELP58488.1 transporter [Clostridium pasteurianum DSM 525 = 